MKKRKKTYSPIRIEIFKSLFASICEEMGEVLCRSSFSPNIKERKDFSCAIFNHKAILISQAAHIPVHLGSMGMAVSCAITSQKLYRGDTIITNDPFNGGTHLPDITVITPIFLKSDTKPSFYLANRAHHADIGASAPGSMPLSNDIKHEGLLLKPHKLIHKGKIDTHYLKEIANQTRIPKTFRADVLSQTSSNFRGQQRLVELVSEYGSEEVKNYMLHILDYQRRVTENFIYAIPNGTYEFEDALDDDGFSRKKIHISLKLTIQGKRAVFDFSKSDAETTGPMNATHAITLACVAYAMRCLMKSVANTSTLSMTPIQVITKENTIVNAMHPRPVAGGNVETSQRVVDVIFGAFSKALPGKIPAGSCGSMNNIAFGGYDPSRKKNFAYYETIGGGMGGRPNAKGIDGVHTHMTNTLNTPIEVLESELPIRVTEYAIRKTSGGKGKHRGGAGLVREFEYLCPTEVTLLTERRKISPYGLNGGQAGAKGKNTLIQDGKKKVLPSKVHLHVKKGGKIRIETPGGGGYGS